MSDPIKYNIKQLLDELFGKKDWHELLETSNKCIAIYPDWYYGYFTRGLGNTYSNKLQEALCDFNKTVELNKNFSGVFWERANVKRLLGNFKGAIDDYIFLITLKPELAADALLSISAVKLAMMDYSDAIEFCSKAIDLNPNLHEAYSNRGIAKTRIKKYESAIIDFNKAISIKPLYVNAIYNKALAEIEIPMTDAAISSLSEVIKLNSNYVEAYNTRGVLKSEKGQYEEALIDFSKAIELNANHARAYNNSGYAKLYLGKNIGACSDWRKAGKLGIRDAYEMLYKYSPQNFDSENSSFESNHEVAINGTINLLSKLADSPSFEDLVRQCVKVDGPASADEMFHVLEYGWENTGHKPVDYSEVYFKVFSQIDI